MRKKRLYNRDLLQPKQAAELDEVEAELGALPKDAGLSEKEFEQRLIKAENRVLRLFPTPSAAAFRENLEVIFVAIVIALALRAYVVQPFKIPTGSMETTLMGISTAAQLDAMPNPFLRLIDVIIEGRTYHTLEGGPEGGVVTAMVKSNFMGIPFIPRTYVQVGNQTELIWTDLLEIHDKSPVQINDVLAPGEKRIFSVTTGDHVFVNKFIYHFRKPALGEVFVFTTQGIEGIKARTGATESQFYIKRCVGLSGDTLFLDPPRLEVNGKVLDTSPVFERMYARADGYPGYAYWVERGYLNPFPSFLTQADPTLTVPANGYWAMGDNSTNSLDSRAWGPVPRENLVGTGMLVYWPFSKRWGRIR